MMGEKKKAIFFGLGRLARNNWLPRIVKAPLLLFVVVFFSLSSAVYSSTEEERKDRVEDDGRTGKTQNDRHRFHQSSASVCVV